MQRVFLDLDGVMADFDTHFNECFEGKEPPYKGNGVSDNEMWTLIHNHGSFFRTMPLMLGAKKFYLQLMMAGVQPIILTAASKSHYAEMALQKIGWVREHFNEDVMVLPTYGSSSKHLFMQNKGDILIDDYKSNCDRWEKAGGIAVQHLGDFNSTFIELQLARERNY